MRENIKEHIEELKEVILELHRSAANLDEYVQMLEIELGNPVLEKQVCGHAYQTLPDLSDGL